MPTNGRLTWVERLDAVQNLLAESASSPVPGLAIPYFDRTLEIEPMLLEVSNAYLRRVPIEQIGDGTTMAIAAGASPVITPTNALRLMSANIDGDSCLQVTWQFFIQNRLTPTRIFTIGCNPGTRIRSIYHNGTSGTFRFVGDQTLGTWQANIALLPPSYDEKTVRDTVRILRIGDNAEGIVPEQGDE